jgi:hypothetical protein
LYQNGRMYFHMSDFWNNVSRYPRFFISSVTGLILVMLAPFRNLLKIKKFQFILPIIFLLFLVLTYMILASMTGL